MQFYFIRHAQSENNALWDRTGSSRGRNMDPEVTEIGRCQADRLADFLSQGQPGQPALDGSDPQDRAGFHLTHLYSSLMVRSVYTASRIAETLNLPVHAWEDAHEEGGIYLDDETAGRQVGQAGKNRAFYEANFPRLVLPDWLGESGWWNRPYETFEQRRPRAQRLLERLMQHHAGTSHRVAVVSHGGFYNHFMAVLLGLAEVGKPWFRLNNGAITRVDFSPEGVVMMYQNRLDYMPAELVT